MGLWFAYPFVQWQGGIDAFEYRCHLMPATPDRDPCFTDYIPLLEMLAFVLTVGLAYPFASFAFSLFSRSAEIRGAGWRLASRSGGSAYFPANQVACGLGILWTALHAQAYPLALYRYLIYWAAWLLWFIIAIWVSWPTGED
jgi:hypothetical protein